MAKKLTNISDSQKEAIEKHSALALPDNPSACGYKAGEIKRALTDPIFGKVDYSLLSLLEKVIDETNNYIDESGKSNSNSFAEANYQNGILTLRRKNGSIVSIAISGDGGNNAYVQERVTGIENCIANGLELSDIAWTPVSDFCGQRAAAEDASKEDNGEYIFKAGKTYRGIPYSSTKFEDNFVGVNVLVETFMTALKNPNSLLYKKQSFAGNMNKNNPTATYGNIRKVYKVSSSGEAYTNGYNTNGLSYNSNSYYGTVCTTILMSMFNLSEYITTYAIGPDNEMWNTLFDKIYDSADETTRDSFDISSLEVGDVNITRTYATGGGHASVISDIRNEIRASDGVTLTSLTIYESGYPVVRNNYSPWNVSGKPQTPGISVLESLILGRHKNADGSYYYEHSIDSTGKKTGQTYEIYRYKNKSSIPFTGSTTFCTIGNKAKGNYKYSQYIGLDKGNKAHYRVSQGSYFNLPDIEDKVEVTLLSGEMTGINVYSSTLEKVTSIPFSSGKAEISTARLLREGYASTGTTYVTLCGRYIVVPYKHDTTSNTDIEYHDDAQEFYIYDTGKIYGLRKETQDGKTYLNGKLGGETYGLEPRYVSLSSYNGAIKKTAEISKIGADLSFRIELPEDWEEGASDPTKTAGAQVLKAHYFHPCGWCVSLPIDITTI